MSLSLIKTISISSKRNAEMSEVAWTQAAGFTAAQLHNTAGIYKQPSPTPAELQLPKIPEPTLAPLCACCRYVL